MGSKSSGEGNSGLKSVKVYLSEFGRKRLAEEDQLGPEELRRGKNSEQAAAEDGLEESDGEGLSDDDFAIGDSDYKKKEKKAREMVRKHQIYRLRYYYALAEFGDAKISEAVYESLDGTEYELSATRFDLRFVPEDTTFDDEPTEICTDMPDPEKYKPKIFFNTALMQGKVNLTWDETNP